MGLLETKDVSYVYQSRYQRVTALKHVSCSFDEGHFYAVVGHSGSGKTTLLSMLAGLGTPTEGSVLFRGEDLKKIGAERHRRENVSVIYQAFHLFPTLTVLENVMYPMQIAGKPAKTAAQTARELLEQVGIVPEQFRKFPVMLSGGEQQRVAVARALSTDAPVILADEPTGNLDTENGAAVVGLLDRLVREKNRCVIVITHDLQIADRADVLYRMVDGTLTREERA